MAHIPLCACIVALAIGGCSKTATVHLRGGGVLEAQITDGDATHIDLNKGGIEDYRVPRKDVASIDHPGGTAATITTVATAILLPLGIYALAVGVPWNGVEGMPDSSPAVTYSGFAALPVSVVTGIAAIWSWSIYGDSVKAANP